ncbi:TetR/AcrR family transcriptional regulator [Rhodovulum sp. ES.010]|uniref:TetR/AcrR family transcriptional regulator n=1 Tax=Rhodovulum sp. ES.010 TaxID=1882821 RepID=UPI0015881166|nr:TetR/AcrR family transcriptional regulator [Rhodovulum sp. ES.010]
MAPEDREKVILDAAERVLMARGVRGPTMAAVACEAGMSKRTLYAVFDGRTALFSALIRRHRETFVAPLGPEQHALPLARRLRLLLAPERLASSGAAPLEVLRVALAEAPEHPELARSVLDEGPRAIRRLIRDELDHAVAMGEIALDDTGTAAALLQEMALPCPVERLLAPDGAPPDPAAFARRIDTAIAVFVAGAGALAPAATARC